MDFNSRSTADWPNAGFLSLGSPSLSPQSAGRKNILFFSLSFLKISISLNSPFTSRKTYMRPSSKITLFIFPPYLLLYRISLSFLILTLQHRKFFIFDLSPSFYSMLFILKLFLTIKALLRNFIVL